MRRVAFLFIHDQPHQIPHCTPVLNEFVATTPEVEVEVFAIRGQIADVVRGQLSPQARATVKVTEIAPPLWSRLAEPLIGGAAPLRRIGALRALAPRLNGFDLVVTPDKTSVMLKTRFGMARPKLAYTKHGAGDRAAGFSKVFRGFDHLFVPDAVLEQRMLAEGAILPGQYTVVGYPKFEAVDLQQPARPLFDNDNPTIVYNPHFDPSLSSWFDDGIGVLDHFANDRRFNLIFAPHVMLFTRKIHATLGLKTIRLRPAVPKRFLGLDNILIDTGSVRSIDMTYTVAADAYLGDVSSQIYEFLYRPRPCIFMNSFGVDWRDDPNFRHWHLGAVADKPAHLGPILDGFAALKSAHHAAQVTAFQAKFPGEPGMARVKGAAALRGLLGLA